MEPVTVANPEAHARRILGAMRLMLVIVSLFAAAAAGIAIWLYAVTIPALKKQQAALEQQSAALKQQNQQQNQQLSDVEDQLSQACRDLATRENQTDHDSNQALLTLDGCMKSFPKDHTLPQYKAQIFASRFAHNHSQGADLEYALQAASLSNKLKPNATAYEWAGLTHCLQARYGPAAGQQAAAQDAVKAFQKEFSLNASRKASIGGMQEFQEYCSPEIREEVLK